MVIAFVYACFDEFHQLFVAGRSGQPFDVGVDTGSAAGHYPADAAIGYPFAGGKIEKVDITLR